MTLEEKERKIKIARLIVMCLIEKGRKLGKQVEVHTLPLIVANIVDIAWWSYEWGKLHSIKVVK